ncbi:uncharacterized protein LOC123524556 isoform X2 [Mercenaria mercenaria]|uniref:uncharacterized protein LOC123524556 isoform X2 n=1 Tax=Mercenaria mercenaria TaxID=6596 RepID=UPI00234ECC44|nr:uncharacterized protein LOC123524556 isoform X2 [Mercenaria mercenaria]
MALLAGKRKEWVLETVDLLRQRKARPDFERISRMLERFHGLTSKESKESLEALVNEGKILKVHFKGNISYRRHASADGNRSNQPSEPAKHTTSHRIIQAIKTITKQTGDGVTFTELEQWLISKNPDTRLVKLRLHTALLREIDAKRVTKLSDHCYVLTDSLPSGQKAKELKPNASPKTLKHKPKASKQTALSDTINASEEIDESNDTDDPKRGRPLSKRKKIKKTHGPDFEDTLQLRRLNSREGSKNGEITCDFCSCTAQSNHEGKQEPLLTCKDCSAKVHPSCMDYSEELAERALNSPWQCMDCKTCCICDGAENDDLILFCDACDKGFHMTCHTPAVTNKPKGSWVCSPCKRRIAKDGNDKSMKKKDDAKSEATSDGSGKEEETSARKGNKRKMSGQTSSTKLKRQKLSPLSSEKAATSFTTDGTVGAPSLPTPGVTPTASPKPSDTFDYEMKMSLLGQGVAITEDKTTYTDASNWNVDDVVKFFDENGFREQSQIFRDQEIDGPSLLLMRREDVLSALGLKLGPALKLYRKIVRVQQCSQVLPVS